MVSIDGVHGSGVGSKFLGCTEAFTRLGFAPMSCRRDKTGYGYAVASLLVVEMVWTRVPLGTSDEGSGA